MGGDDIPKAKTLIEEMISIHTTRVGGDRYSDDDKDFKDISIHTTRVGGDCSDFLPLSDNDINFNPHHPCGW